jgi:tetratricopeptide (TPR) repeat protein
VFISYAQGDPEHEGLVRELWVFLRACGIDARLDLAAAADRVDWAAWMTVQVRDADRVLVVASPAYKKRAEGDAGPGEGRGVQWEARLIRDLFLADPDAGMRRCVPVILPGGSAEDIPLWLAPAAGSVYRVSGFTVTGAEDLLRLLTGQPAVLVPELGPVPPLPPLAAGAAGSASVAAGRPGVHTEVVIEAAVSQGVVTSAVWAAGSLVGRHRGAIPAEVAGVWTALGLPGAVAGERLAAAGRALVGVLLGPDAEVVVAGLVEEMSAADSAEVVLCADGDVLGLPVELLRLRTAQGGEAGPLGLLPAVAVSRRPQPWRGETDVSPPRPAPRAGLAGPLKVLAAVAAPEETRTASPPLDAEAEMAAVLDAVAGITAAGQVRILEVASLQAIREALEQDAYHVLHLSAHGSAESVELEDEDGNPVPVGLRDLVQALQLAGRVVPLIVLSSCSGGAAGSRALAAGLAGRGADRVIAMLAPVTDPYATTLAGQLYRQLAGQPELTAGRALARARVLAEQARPRERDRVPVPEFGVVTLVAAGGDGPLADPALPPAPLAVATTPPGGRLVRDLPMGALIGRRAQLRAAMGVLRREQGAVDRFGAASGVVLTGIGGIGKTALAGRVIARLGDEGWLAAVHEGRWNPAALITAVTRAVQEGMVRASDPASAAGLRAALDELAAPGDDGPKLAVVAGLLAEYQLLVVFDDFEQNLTPGGDAFLDPSFDDILTGLADAARTGGLLVTCRYPLPGPDRFLARIPVPALSRAELRRLFLRLPALRDLEAEDRRVLARAVGGHPRLIEFTDALLRGGRAGFRHVQTRLRDLARRQGADLAADRSLDGAVEQALLLGSADILLEGLTGLLTQQQAAVLRQVAVCRAPMTLDDLESALAAPGAGGGAGPGRAQLAADVTRLADLTLLGAGDDIAMHPWTAELVTRNTSGDLAGEHERALAMRFRRFDQARGSYADMVDIPRHLAALGRYYDAAGIAEQAERMLPGTVAVAAYLAEVRPLIPPAERAWIIVADMEVRAMLRAGDLRAATRQLQAIHAQVQARAAADPANTEWQRDLSVSHERLGNVAVAAGDLTAARTAYQASLDIRARLAAADPANTGRQHELAISHIKLGDAARDAGDLAAARTAYQASLDIMTRLAAADPANTDWQRDLSISHERLGNVALEAGDLAAARTAYQARLDIMTRLAAADPADTDWQRELSVSHIKLGDVAIAAGDLAAARAACQASLDIRVRLAAADPANTGWQRDLSISHERLGGVAIAAGDLAAARDAYQAAQDIMTRLAAADPANTGWQRDLSVSHIMLGDVARAAGDLAAARDAYQAAQDIMTRLAAANPANPGWQRDLSVSHIMLGDVARAAGDLAATRDAYQASLDIMTRLAAANPANTGWQRDLEGIRQMISSLEG